MNCDKRPQTEEAILAFMMQWYDSSEGKQVQSPERERGKQWIFTSSCVSSKTLEPVYTFILYKYIIRQRSVNQLMLDMKVHMKVQVIFKHSAGNIFDFFIMSVCQDSKPEIVDFSETARFSFGFSSSFFGQNTAL